MDALPKEEILKKIEELDWYELLKKMEEDCYLYMGNGNRIEAQLDIKTGEIRRVIYTTGTSEILRDYICLVVMIDMGDYENVENLLEDEEEINTFYRVKAEMENNLKKKESNKFLHEFLHVDDEEVLEKMGINISERYGEYMANEWLDQGMNPWEMDRILAEVEAVYDGEYVE